MANFEDVQAVSSHTILINTMHEHEQGIVIKNTVPCHLEITAVENAIRMKRAIIIYGKHSNDMSIHVKYKQIQKLGGIPILYTGGLFEWLLLHDIYGESNFPIVGNVTNPIDLYKYKPPTYTPKV